MIKQQKKISYIPPSAEIREVFVADTAVVTGDVDLGHHVNIWYGAIIRGDHGAITIGPNTNIQDNAVVHDHTHIGASCTIGHGAIVHGCTVGDHCLIGMGAIILSGAVIEDHCLIGAGALVTGKTVAPAGSLLLGNPAKVIKPLTPDQLSYIDQDAQEYVDLAFGSPESPGRQRLF